ncbi:MAG: tyrosine-type recombinase/integrase [Acidimicrobiia bacterium]|nr:tyrosine-type recombinase/integrase [Acidimicrobiia bacterium]
MRKSYQLLAAALDAAVESGLIGRSPCRGVKLPKLETTAEIRFLDAAEINLLADAIDSRYSAMVLAAAYTGLRFSELRALRVDRINALRRTIRVAASLVEAEASSTSRNRNRRPRAAPSACHPSSSTFWLRI